MGDGPEAVEGRSSIALSNSGRLTERRRGREKLKALLEAVVLGTAYLLGAAMRWVFDYD